MRNFYQRRAFTLTELLVVLAIIAVLGVLIPIGVSQVNKAKRIRCVSSLKNIGLSLRGYASDHGEKFPMQVSTNEGGVKEWMGSGTNVFRVFQSISNWISTPVILTCKKDTRLRSTGWTNLQNVNISYFLGVDAEEQAYPEKILAGDRNLQTSVAKDRDGFLSLTTNDVVTWSKAMHRNAGNILLADGSIQQVNNERLGRFLRNTGMATNRFMLPD